MKRIALVTYKEEPKVTYGEKLLYEELVSSGYSVTETPWDDETIDWKIFNIVILRAAWNYHTHIHQFKVWLNMLKNNGVNVWNQIDTILWNIDKHYLKELEKKDISIIPTYIIERGMDFNLEEIINKLGSEIIIVKPCVGASAYGVGKFEKEKLSEIRNYIEKLLEEGDVMIQKFMPQILSQGEYSFIFFNKKFSHAVLKKPSNTDFRTQPHWGGTEDVVYPSENLIEQAKKIVKAVDSKLLYTRVDGVDDNGILRLMELELTEPYLFFEYRRGAPKLFIIAMNELI